MVDDPGTNKTSAPIPEPGSPKPRSVCGGSGATPSNTGERTCVVQQFVRRGVTCTDEVQDSAHTVDVGVLYGVGQLAGAVAHEPSVQSEFAKTEDAVGEAKSRAVAGEAKVNLLDASLANHKRYMSRLITDFAAAKSRVTELEREEATAAENLTTARNSVQEASTAVFDSEDKDTNFTLQV